MGVYLSDEEANSLAAILKDHKDCIEQGERGFNDRCTSGEQIMQQLASAGVDAKELGWSADLLDSRANLIWEIDELVRVLEGGDST